MPVAGPPSQAPLLATTTGAVWVRVGTLLDGSATGAIRDAHLVYDAHGIRYAGADRPPATALRSGAVSPDVSLPDWTVMPGLIDAHVHLFLEGQPMDAAVRKAGTAQSPEALVRQGAARLEKIVGTGVMAVRDAGDNRGVNLALRKQYLDRPRVTVLAYLDAAGAAVHRRGRYGKFYGLPLEDFPDAAACVESRRAAGADRLKLIATDIIDFALGAVTKPPQLTEEDVTALVAAARERNLPTFAHASGADGIEHVVEGGIDTVEHGFFVTGSQLARMRDRRIAWVPTFIPVQVQVDRAGEMAWSPEALDGLRRILDGHARAVRQAHDLGVMILAGSDAGSCGVPHGLGLLNELELLERAGMPAATVLHAATGASAAALQFKEPVGRLAPGHLARMIFLRHSPLASVGNLRKERVVVFDGTARAESGSTDSAGL